MYARDDRRKYSGVKSPSALMGTFLFFLKEPGIGHRVLEKEECPHFLWGLPM
jgi:hypothetical protein